MLVPIRCFTCGSVIAHKYEDYAERVKKGEDPAKALDKLGIKRYCCRRMILSHVDAIDDVIKYSK